MALTNGVRARYTPKKTTMSAARFKTIEDVDGRKVAMTYETVESARILAVDRMSSLA
jgi:hypothetical protein